MADVNETLKKLNDTPDLTEEFDPEDIEKNKLMGILAYIHILVLIPIFAAKDSKFARLHANQGLVLFIAAVIFEILMGALSWIPIVNIIIFIIGGLGHLCWLALVIIGILNVANGKAKELPIIGKFRILK